MASDLQKTLIIPISLEVLQNFGSVGISRLAHGFVIMFIFHWEVIESLNGTGLVIFLLSGCLLVSGMEQIGRFCAGDYSILSC